MSLKDKIKIKIFDFVVNLLMFLSVQAVFVWLLISAMEKI